MINKSPSDSANADSSKHGVPSKPTMLHMQEKIDPRLQRGFHEASGPTTSEHGSYSAFPGQSKYTALFDSVVYPTIKKSKKRHKDDLPRKDLNDIDKTVSLFQY